MKTSFFQSQIGRFPVGVERVGYSTRIRRVLGDRSSDRITRVLGANHLSV